MKKAIGNHLDEQNFQNKPWVVYSPHKPAMLENKCCTARRNNLVKCLILLENIKNFSNMFSLHLI